MRSWTKFVLLGLCVTMLGGGAWRYHRLLNAARQEAAAAWVAKDSTQLVLTATEADRDRYRTLFEQAKLLKGKPVAGAVIVIPKTDTLWRDSLITTTLPDSTRLGRFQRVAADGTSVDVRVTAPPCCDALRAEVEVTVPADSITVGFITVGTRTVAVARSRHRVTEVTVPFFVPPKASRWTHFVEALGDPEALTVRGGSQFRVISGWSATAVVDRRFTRRDATRVLVGVRRSF